MTDDVRSTDEICNSTDNVFEIVDLLRVFRTLVLLIRLASILILVALTVGRKM